MDAIRALAVVVMFGWSFTLAVYAQQDLKTAEASDAIAVGGWVNGKKVQSASSSLESGAEAAAKVLEASALTDFLNPGQAIDKDIWKRQVAFGIENKRPHLYFQFRHPWPVEGRLNGKKTTLSVSEVVFFEPTDQGPVCLWARDGDKYYFANQIAGHEALAKWLAKVQEK